MLRTLNGLNQILTFDRDTRSQEWDYDGLGNWNSIANDGGSPETRTHNAQNEITGISNATTPTYDANGNMTGDEEGREFVFDAWNRLVRVLAGETRVEYQYDAITRRIVEDDGTDDRHLYYSPAWQVLEERISDTPVTQYVWSPVYIDAMILRDRSVSGTLDERLWVAHDANFNVTALIAANADVVERFTYTPFGVATVHEGDYAVKGSSDFVWQYRHQGGRWSAESNLSYSRFRDESHRIGRWNSPDPIQYYSGTTNLYSLKANNSINYSDPFGLASPLVPILVTAGRIALPRLLPRVAPSVVPPDVLIGGASGGALVGNVISGGPVIRSAASIDAEDRNAMSKAIWDWILGRNDPIVPPPPLPPPPPGPCEFYYAWCRWGVTCAKNSPRWTSNLHECRQCYTVCIDAGGDWPFKTCPISGKVESPKKGSKGPRWQTVEGPIDNPPFPDILPTGRWNCFDRNSGESMW